MARCSPSQHGLLLRPSATAEVLPTLCWCSPLCESQILALRSAGRPSHTLSGIFSPHRSLRISLLLLRSLPCSFRCTAAASDIYVALRGSMAHSLVHYSNPGQVHHRDVPSTRRPCLHLLLPYHVFILSGGPLCGPSRFIGVHPWPLC